MGCYAVGSVPIISALYPSFCGHADGGAHKLSAHNSAHSKGVPEVRSQPRSQWTECEPQSCVLSSSSQLSWAAAVLGYDPLFRLLPHSRILDRISVLHPSV